MRSNFVRWTAGFVSVLLLFLTFGLPSANASQTRYLHKEGSVGPTIVPGFPPASGMIGARYRLYFDQYFDGTILPTALIINQSEYFYPILGTSAGIPALANHIRYDFVITDDSVVKRGGTPDKYRVNHKPRYATWVHSVPDPIIRHLYNHPRVCLIVTMVMDFWGDATSTFGCRYFRTDAVNV